MIDCLLAYDDTRELGGIRAPTQLLWGDHDALFPRDQQDAFLAALPEARLKVYPETGHCPNWERPDGLQPTSQTSSRARRTCSRSEIAVTYAASARSFDEVC